MHATNICFIEELYLWSIQEVVCHYSGHHPTVVPDESPAFGEGMAAIIGFGSDKVSGASVLMCEPDSVRNLFGSEILDHMDWLGELNNQSVGRLKNKLIRHSINVQLSTPVVTKGNKMDFASNGHHSSRWIIEWEGGMMSAFLSLNISEELEIAEPEAESVVEEGTLTFF